MLLLSLLFAFHIDELRTESLENEEWEIITTPSMPLRMNVEFHGMPTQPIISSNESLRIDMKTHLVFKIVFNPIACHRNDTQHVVRIPIFSKKQSQVDIRENSFLFFSYPSRGESYFENDWQAYRNYRMQITQSPYHTFYRNVNVTAFSHTIIVKLDDERVCFSFVPLDQKNVTMCLDRLLSDGRADSFMLFNSAQHTCPFLVTAGNMNLLRKGSEKSKKEVPGGKVSQELVSAVTISSVLVIGFTIGINIYLKHIWSAPEPQKK
ncbi:unnamed protein product [Caenorhabditis auriculariae]|uniref:Uncharacterized protein n=1 Tax=Caenorhabditis auriculariae TaxID=2777116 RepID=A0A8S1H008_9PELO|nr:unnamed protein product [Caenorhabditis auriculariae]